MQTSTQRTCATDRQRSRRRGRGLVVVELAILMPVFILMIFAMLDFSRMMFTKITLQHAMREAGRFGVTGRSLPDPNHPETLQSRLASIKQVVREKAIGVQVDPNTIYISSVSGGANNAGGPGDTFTLSLDYEFHFITPFVGKYFDNGGHAFTVSTTFRNEPFPPGAET